ncbi:hypothetical protein KG830_004726 [Salmonella enterica]|nr:hypothetical protein [Salmonella enterica]EGF6396240.1 hypothetical protein [Salmonella enterica subsp. enterica serovar Rottnest]MIE46730.1 hypothetical protein [Salmonella enterica subsp. enterica]EGF6398111.1 hypothetical protein [Salmonella enterica subsp. enterica serovar Rottnest]EHM8828711.1 hypothetical protein [Salmonella enterica]
MSSRIASICAVIGLLIAAATFYFQFRNDIYENLYQKNFLTGKWSNDADLIINSKDLGLNNNEPLVTIQMNVDDDGSIDGEIISEGLCDGMPLTWNITFNSESPTLKNFVLARKFQVRQLVDGAMDKSPVVATLKLIEEDQKHKSITFEVVDDPARMLPKKLTAAKDLPKFEENYNYLQEYCANSTLEFFKKRAIERKNTMNNPNPS